MSYNVNDLFQQWQQQPLNTNNQQLQPVTQQASSGQPTPGGNYQQSQQSCNWIDGNTQGQHHQSTQSWSWQGQTASSTIQSPPVLATPPLLMENNPHQQLHQHIHQSALSHHQQALAHHQQVANMIHQNMTPFVDGTTPTIQQALQQAQIAYQTPLSQPGITDQQSVIQQPQSRPQIAYPSTPTSIPQPQATELQHQQPASQSSPAHQLPAIKSPQHQATQPGLLAQQQLQPPNSDRPSQGRHALQQAPQQTHHDEQFRGLEKRRQRDAQDMNRAGAELNKRLRGLEQTNTRAQSDREAKDRELRQLQQQLAANETQRRQDAERHSQQLAELARSQATPPATQAPAFDMSALQKVIRETQAQQLSAQDVEKVIEEQVSKRLAGMATKAIIQSAGMTMQNALSQVPAGLSEAQVQQAVNRELNSVMQNVADRVNRRRAIASQRQQDLQTQQPPASRVETHFEIEELSEDDAVPQPQFGEYHRQSQRALPTANAQVADSRVAVSPATLTALTVNQSSFTYQPPATEAVRSAAPSGTSAQTQISAIAKVHSTPQQPTQLSLQPHPSTNSSAPIGDGAVPFSTRATQALEAAPYQRQLEAGPAPVQDLSNARAQADAPRISKQMPLALPTQQIEAVAPQRQLEAGPAPVQDLSVARTQTTAPQMQTQAQLAMPPRQLGAAPTQKQLEAASFAPTSFSSTGKELVHQSRDVSRRT